MTLWQGVGSKVQVALECTGMARPHGCKLLVQEALSAKCAQMFRVHPAPLINCRKMNAGIRPGGGNPGLNHVPLQQP